MADLNNKYNIPCDGCVHTEVCGIKQFYDTTEVVTEHPCITVELGCKKYANAAEFKKAGGSV